jgi:hypothetical protein
VPTGGVRNRHPGQHRDQRADRDVDEHHPAPRGDLGEDAADHQAEGHPAHRDGRVQTEGTGALPALREHRGQQGERRRRCKRGTDALDHPGCDEFGPRGGEAARQGGQREDGDAGQERRTASQQVSGAGAEEQQATKGEAVGVEHPGQSRGAEPERGLHVRQRDVHDAHVEHHHELGDQDDGEDQAGSSRAPFRARPGRLDDTGSRRVVGEKLVGHWMLRSEDWCVGGGRRMMWRAPPLNIRRVPPFSKGLLPCQST